MFFAPLSDARNPASKLITQHDFEKLFRNLNEIYSINTEFLKDLKQCAELQEAPSNQPRQTIGQVFLMYSEYFKAYGLYCAGHNAALATLKKLEVCVVICAANTNRGTNSLLNFAVLSLYERRDDVIDWLGSTQMQKIDFRILP